jgi:hypothetical protein
MAKKMRDYEIGERLWTNDPWTWDGVCESEVVEKNREGLIVQQVFGNTLAKDKFKPFDCWETEAGALRHQIGQVESKIAGLNEQLEALRYDLERAATLAHGTETLPAEPKAKEDVKTTEGKENTQSTNME